MDVEVARQGRLSLFKRHLVFIGRVGALSEDHFLLHTLFVGFHRSVD